MRGGLGLSPIFYIQLSVIKEQRIAEKNDRNKEQRLLFAF